jgi:transcription elongation factor GreA
VEARDSGEGIALREQAMEIVTKAEREALEARLAGLIANRPNISKRIAEAREHGDLRENGDYHAAREQQGLEEAEIRRIEERLRNTSVIDEKMAKAVEGVVFLGSMVRLREEPGGDEDVYKLVGEASGSPPADYFEVTATSPLGEALLKTRVGETIRVQLPRGPKSFTILEILS